MTNALRVGPSEVQVRQLTRMELSQLVAEAGTLTTTINLRVGRLRANVNTAEGLRNDFRVRSPVSTAAVRGTRFDAEVIGLGGLRTQVFNGVVLVGPTVILDDVTSPTFLGGRALGANQSADTDNFGYVRSSLAANGHQRLGDRAGAYTVDQDLGGDDSATVRVLGRSGREDQLAVVTRLQHQLFLTCGQPIPEMPPVMVTEMRFLDRPVSAPDN